MRMRRLLKLLNLKEGEVRLFSVVSSLFFVISFGVILGKNVRDSLFLSFYGVEKLPYMYILSPFFVIAASAAITRYMVRRHEAVASFRIMSLSAVVLAALTPVVYIGHTLGHPLVFAGMYILVQVILATELILFWWVAVRVFDSRQAKRIFPLVLGCGMVAAVLAGLSIRFLVEAVHVEWIFAIWAALVFSGGCIFLKLMPYFPPRGPGARGRPPPKKHGETKEMWNLIRKSSLLRCIITTALLMWVVSMLVDFSFKSAITAHFEGAVAGTPDPVASSAMIASFLGLFQGVISAISLLLQVFVTARIISLIGVGSSPLVYSIGMAFSTCAMWLSSWGGAVFHSTVGAKFTDETIQGTIDQADSHLRYNGLAEKDKGRAHTFVSGVVKPVSAVIAGVSLICLRYVSPAWISAAAFLLSLAWLAVSFRVRKLYIEAMVENLMSGDLFRRVQAREVLSESRDPRAIKIIERAMESPDERVCLFALELITAMGFKKLPRAFERCCRSQDAEIKKAALGAVEATKSENFLPWAVGLLRDSDPSVVARAVLVLSRMKGAGILPDIEQFVHSKERIIQSSAIIAIVRHGTTEARDECRSIIGNMLSSPDEDDRGAGAYILGQLKSSWFVTRLLDLLSDKSPAVRARAATALGLLGESSAIPALIDKLTDRDVRGSSIRALMNLADIGSAELAEKLFDRDMPPAIRRPLPAILARSQSKEVSGILIRALGEEDPLLCRSLLVALHSMVASGGRTLPDHAAINDYIERELRAAYLFEVYRHAVLRLPGKGRKVLLLHLVEERGRAARERLFRALGLIYHFQTVMSIYWKLSSVSRKVKADSLEAVEGIMEKEVSRRLLPLFECDDPRELARAAGEIAGVGFSDSEQLYRHMIAEGDRWFKLVAYYLSVRCENSTVRETMGRVVDAAGFREDEKMLLTMEKVFFLKSASLFSRISLEDLFVLAEHADEQSFPQDRVIFREGDYGDAFHIILSGMVRIVAGGQEVARLGPKEYFGEMALLDDLPRSADAVAGADTTTLAIDRESFRMIMSERPDVAFGIIRVLSGRLREMLKK